MTFSEFRARLWRGLDHRGNPRSVWAIIAVISGLTVAILCGAGMIWITVTVTELLPHEYRGTLFVIVLVAVSVVSWWKVWKDGEE